MKFPVHAWLARVAATDRPRLDELTRTATNSGGGRAATVGRLDDTDDLDVAGLVEVLAMLGRAGLTDEELAPWRNELLRRTDVGWRDALDDLDEAFEEKPSPPGGRAASGGASSTATPPATSTATSLGATPPPGASGTTTSPPPGAAPDRTAPPPPGGTPARTAPPPPSGTTARTAGATTGARRPAVPAPVEERLEQQQRRRERLIQQGLTDLGGTGTTWAARAAAITAWRQDVKDREKATGRTPGEQWTMLYAANRMSIRQVDQYVVKGQYFSVRRRTVAPGESEDQPIRLARDPRDILARLDPANFGHQGGAKSRKDELGLHHLSASLLDHAKPIPGQLKGYSDALAIFMPVPSERDGRIFLAVAELARAAGVTTELIQLRAELTRITFAQGCDMHTTYLDIGDAPGRPRIRYGVAGTVRRTKGADSSVVEVDEADLLKRSNDAVEHSAILGDGATEPANEIVLAYRAHNSPVFPLFAEWSAEDERFYIVTLSDNPAFAAWRRVVDDIEARRQRWVDALPTELEREKVRGESDWPADLRLPARREKRYATTRTGPFISRTGVWSDR